RERAGGDRIRGGSTVRGDVHRDRDHRRPRVPADAAGRYRDLYSGPGQRLRCDVLPSVPRGTWFLGRTRERRDPWVLDVSVRVGAAPDDVAGSHRRSPRDDHRHPGHIRCDRATRERARLGGIRRGALGAVAQHLLHREGLQSLFPALQHGDGDTARLRQCVAARRLAAPLDHLRVRGDPFDPSSLRGRLLEWQNRVKTPFRWTSTLTTPRPVRGNFSPRGIWWRSSPTPKRVERRRTRSSLPDSTIAT